jgi:hypothetical protein
MRPFRLTLMALAVCTTPLASGQGAFAAMPSAGHASQASIGDPWAQATELAGSAAHVTGWFDPAWRAAVKAGTRQVLYVSVPEEGVVDVFSADIHVRHAEMIGQIVGLDSPEGIAVDAARNLYVAQGDAGAPILVFAPGEMEPSRTLDTEGNVAEGVAVARNGDVFAGTGPPRGAGVLIYRHGETAPSGMLAAGGDTTPSIALDRAGNIYLVSVMPASVNGILEFQRTGDRQWRTLLFGGRGLHPPDPWSLGFDRNDDLVTYQWAHPSASLTVYPARARVGERSHRRAIPQPFSVSSFGFNHAQDALYVGTSAGVGGAGRVVEYAYGGRTGSIVAMNVIDGLGGNVAGVAAAPAPPLPRPWSP